LPQDSSYGQRNDSFVIDYKDISGYFVGQVRPRAL
jgi:hypothetical protein